MRHVTKQALLCNPAGMRWTSWPLVDAYQLDLHMTHKPSRKYSRGSLSATSSVSTLLLFISVRLSRSIGCEIYIMEVLELRRSPMPLGSTGAGINRDAGSCSTCFNLSSHSLQDAFFLNSWIFVSERGTNAFKRATTEQNITTSDHTEYNAFTFIVKLTDIPGSVAAGCESCLLLSIATKNLCSELVDFKDPSLFLNITLCKGNALRFILFQDTYYVDNENAEPEEQLGFDGFEGGIPSGKAFGAWELYTLKGTALSSIDSSDQRC